MAQARETWARLIARHGIDCEIKRGQTSATVIMARQYSTEDKLANEISQSAIRFVVEHLRLQGAGFPLPPKRGDKIKSEGLWYTVQNVESKFAYNELVGYRMEATGG